VRPATPAEIDRWDDLVRANPDGGHALQSRAWGDFKRRAGWVPLHLVHEGAGGPLAILFLRRRLPGLGWLCYAPKGPGVTSVDAVHRLLDDRGSLPDAVCVQVEPELPDTPENRAALSAAGLRKSEDVQISRATVFVDVSRDEDEMLASFKPKTRYNVRLAQRRGVIVEPVACTPTAIATMHRLMASAFARAALPLRPVAYFSGYWRLFEACGQGQLFLARHGDEILAGAYVMLLGDKAWYKDGGSLPGRSELMAPHLLQWEIMRWLHARGVASYDLFAVPRADEPPHQSSLRGLRQFKTGFSTDVRQFVGTWDLVLDESRYRLWRRMVEPAVRRVLWRLRGDLWY
jgi:lipid II:glycine glycyltransferase (peptidoglycan interpeptide bridge formation enzyme)